jgi:outer membrane lipoprotein-sorting protein
LIDTLTTRRALMLDGIVLGLMAAAPALAQPSPDDLTDDDKALVAKAAAYLEGLGELKGRFEQTDARGGVAHGDLYLSRPGRARFAYDAPDNRLMISDGHTVWVSDPRLKTLNHYPLRATPLALFLSEHVRLDHGVVVTQVDRFSDGFALTARDGRHQAQGQIVLVFGSDPMRLREWSLTDAQGRTVRVRLTGLKPTPGLDPALFSARGATEPQP